MTEREGADTEAAAELAPGRAWRRVAQPAGGPWLWLGPALAAAALGAVYLLRSVLTPFLCAGLLCYLVAPLVDTLQRRVRLPRALAILGSYAALGLFLAAFAAFVLPGLIGELQRLAAGLPALFAGAEARLAAARAGYRGLPLPPALRSAADAALLRGEAGARAALGQALAGLLGAFGLVFPLLLAPVIAFYLLADLPRLRAQWARLLPPGARQPVALCLGELDAVLAGWVRGELLVALAVGSMATAAVLLLHLRYAFTLGLVAGLGELLPYFGPVLGALPALAVAGSSGGLPAVLYTAVAFLAIQQVESAFLAPRVVGGAVGLHPLVVIGALLLGERLGGLAGVVLAVPAAGCLRVLARHGVRALTAAHLPRRLT